MVFGAGVKLALKEVVVKTEHIYQQLLNYKPIEQDILDAHKVLVEQKVIPEIRKTEAGGNCGCLR